MMVSEPRPEPYVLISPGVSVPQAMVEAMTNIMKIILPTSSVNTGENITSESQEFVPFEEVEDPSEIMLVLLDSVLEDPPGVYFMLATRQPGQAPPPRSLDTGEYMIASKSASAQSSSNDTI